MRFSKDMSTHNETAGKKYWGKKDLPLGAKIIGTIKDNAVEGALIKLASGMYAKGRDGEFKLLSALNEESRTPR